MVITADPCTLHDKNSLTICMHPAWLHVKPAELKMNAEGEYVWNQSLVLFITFEAIALTTVPASWCPLHDLNAKGQRSLYKDLRRPLEHLQNTCVFWSLPRTSIFGYTEHTSIIEFGQIWCYDLWRESRTYFAELHAGFDRSFFLVFILQNWNFITIRVLNYLIIAFSHEVGYSRNRLARKRANFERRF